MSTGMRYLPPTPVDLRLTLAPLCRGHLDPTMRVAAGEVWRASRTAEGPVTMHLVERDGGIDAEVWGVGGSAALERIPALLGAGDDDSGYAPRHPLLEHLRRRLTGLRIPASGAVLEALVPSILEQKVVGFDARQSYRRLVRRLAEAAPGDAGLLLPPAPTDLAGAPLWLYHECGVERRRAEAIRRAAIVAPRLEECVALPLSRAGERLTAIPGVGPWTVAEVAIVALGDADAVPVGDFHLPNAVAWALAHEPRADDARMLALLEPYRPHRGRVIRHIVAARIQAPRRGPRLTRRDLSRI